MWFGAWASVVPTWQTAGRSIVSQSEFVSVGAREENGECASFTSLFTSAGILHGLHSDEALPALRPGQQPLLLLAAAWRRALPPKPAVHLASSTQIPNEHAREEPNGHGWHAVPSAAGTSANARAPSQAAWLHGCTCDVQHAKTKQLQLLRRCSYPSMALRTSFCCSWTLCSHPTPRYLVMSHLFISLRTPWVHA